jgi:hypothetical protein
MKEYWKSLDFFCNSLCSQKEKMPEWDLNPQRLIESPESGALSAELFITECINPDS